MPPKPSSGSVGKDMSVYWEKVFSYRAKTTTNVQETTVSEMLRIIFPEFRLKIIRHFHGTAKMNTTTTIGYLIAAAKMQPVRNIVEGTELLSDLTEAILNGEGDEHFDVTTCEELHQLVAAMVTVEKDMMAGFVSPLHMAAVCDLPLAVSFLIDNGASTETVDTEGATPLLIAATIARTRIVRVLCERGANVEFRQKGGHNVLFAATAAGHKAVVDVLLEYKADPNIPHKSGSVPLWIAAANGHVGVAESLLNAGAYKNEPVNMRTVVEADSSCGESIKNVIESLEKRGKLKKPEGEWSEDDGANLLGVLSSVVGAGAKKKGDQASSSVITKCGATPLWIAACNGHGKMVSLLVQRGARTETMCDSTSPLWIAAANGNFEAIQALCYHADKESRAIDGATPLWVACENGHRECVRHLLDAGSKIDARTIDQRTPLHIASANRHLGIVVLLLQRGADASAVAVDGSTPAHLLMSAGASTSGAGSSEWEEILAILVNAGVQLEAKRVDGANILHVAVRTKDLEQINFILTTSAVDPNQCSEDGLTPLHEAAQAGDLEIVRALITTSQKVDVNIRSTEGARHPGATALWLSAKMGHAEVVELLLAHDADVNITCGEVTPMMVAIEEGHTDCISFLQRATKKLLQSSKRSEFARSASAGFYPSFLLKVGNCELKKTATRPRR